MKNSIKESIRQLLIKTILPLREKKEELLGKFRFSIAFRISLHYLKLLIITGVMFMIAFSILYYCAEWRNCNKKVDEIKLNFLEYLEHDNYQDFLINPYKDQGISLKIVDKYTEKILYCDIIHDISKEKKWFDFIYYAKDEDNSTDIILYEKMEMQVKENQYVITFQYDLSDTREKLIWLTGVLSIVYAIFMYFVILSGKKSDVKLLKPLNEMSATANHLTVNNLHSKRLNVEGTKNELKDLANVFNNMLDRIEISYESQKQFVSDASHELRTPIAVIQGYANLLNRWGTKDEEVLFESIDAISNESKSMQDLVEKLLYLSRHDKKTLKLEKKRFNMCTVVEDMIKETRLVTQNRNIENNILDNVIVYADKQALKQAIRVFIDNAIKYTNVGDTITIDCKNENGDCIISIEDTGIGMTRKDVDNIFERFYRSEQVRDEKRNGHGLGLSIAKLIILGHTGKIKVKSQLTKGTVFTITLPWRYSKN